MKNVVVLVALMVVGCGGARFTTDFGRLEDGGIVDESTGGASSSFGGSSTATGGATSVASAGGTDDGGVACTGGAAGSGSIPDAGETPDANACVVVTHSDGVGQTWQDCIPLKTCNANQALRACIAYCEANSGCKCTTVSQDICGAHGGVHAPYDQISGTELAWGEGASPGAVEGQSVVYRVTIGAGYSSCAYAGEWE